MAKSCYGTAEDAGDGVENWDAEDAGDSVKTGDALNAVYMESPPWDAAQDAGDGDETGDAHEDAFLCSSLGGVD